MTNKIKLMLSTLIFAIASMQAANDHIVKQINTPDGVILVISVDEQDSNTQQKSISSRIKEYAQSARNFVWTNRKAIGAVLGTVATIAGIYYFYPSKAIAPVAQPNPLLEGKIPANKQELIKAINKNAPNVPAQDLGRLTQEAHQSLKKPQQKNKPQTKNKTKVVQPKQQPSEVANALNAAGTVADNGLNAPDNLWAWIQNKHQDRMKKSLEQNEQKMRDKQKSKEETEKN